MTIETIPIRDRESWLANRRQDVTASVAGALLGEHDYMTGFALWALKSGRIDEDPEETPAMKRGRLLEPVAVELLKEERPSWVITNPHIYLRDPDIRLGATPDRYVIDKANPKRGRGIVQVKTAAYFIFKQKWIDRDTREIMLPLWIAVQALIEAELAGASWACVALLVVGMGLDLHVIDIELTPTTRKIINRVKAETVKFWDLVASGEVPDPDFARDGRVISNLYAEDDGGILDLSNDAAIKRLVGDRATLKATIKRAEDDLKAIDARLKFALGNHALAYIGGGEKITYLTQYRAEHTVPAWRGRILKTPARFSATATEEGPF